MRSSSHLVKLASADTMIYTVLIFFFNNNYHTGLAVNYTGNWHICFLMHTLMLFFSNCNLLMIKFKTYYLFHIHYFNEYQSRKDYLTFVHLTKKVRKPIVFVCFKHSKTLAKNQKSFELPKKNNVWSA